MRTSIRYRQQLSALGVLLGLLVAMSSIVYPASVAADRLGSRSLMIGSEAAGATTTHHFTLTYTSSTDIGSVQFEYCTSPLFDLPCDAPNGLDASGAALTAQTGEAGFSILNASSNNIVLTRTASTPVNNASTYTFVNIINPSDNGAFFVRISTHAASDASDANVDFGAVANSIGSGVGINTEVPPILKFCVGLTLADDCTTADDNLVDLGDLSPSKAASGSSQMLAATNAQFGLAIAAYGTTMTSGNNVIPALNKPTLSAPGNAQFGLNLRKNSDPKVGEEPAGIGISNPTTDYNLPNRYLFRSGDVVATSPDATDVRKFTSSYVVNVPPSQVPGVYTATITYICTATF